MYELIRRALDSVRALAVLPGTGRRRAAQPAYRVNSVVAPRRRVFLAAWNPPRVPASPDELDAGTAEGRWMVDDGPHIDGDASPLVRPYLLAHEQRQRRTALALALDGIDIGPHIIHGVPVGVA